MNMESLHAQKNFVLLIYPFRHAVTGRERMSRLRSLSPHWKPWWARMNAKEQSLAWDDTYFFLPQVRELLFPETVADVPQTFLTPDTFSNLSPEQYAEKVSSDGVLRLTYEPSELAELNPLKLTFKNYSMPVTFHWIDLLLFPQNVGFLVLKVEVDEAPLSVARIQ